MVHPGSPVNRLVFALTPVMIKKPDIFSIAGFLFFGAGEMNRTPDLLITNELLYRLSYTGWYIFG